MPTASTPAAGSGRWSLTRDLHHPVTPTEQLAARANQLLERHGVVVRDAVLAESVPGGLAALYPIYAALEEAGRLRRGYFVEGLGGAQFALPGAVDRLRSTESASIVLAAADPANPYGAAVPWPESDGRPSRRAGAYVVMLNGMPSVFVERGGRSLVTFESAAHDPALTAHAVADIGRRHIGRMTIERVDGNPVADSLLAAALLEAGFVQGYKGLTLRP
jgi:ATP-dependent Lhr-like helicase